MLSKTQSGIAIIIGMAIVAANPAQGTASLLGQFTGSVLIVVTVAWIYNTRTRRPAHD